MLKSLAILNERKKSGGKRLDWVMNENQRSPKFKTLIPGKYHYKLGKEPRQKNTPSVFFQNSINAASPYTKAQLLDVKGVKGKHVEEFKRRCLAQALIL